MIDSTDLRILDELQRDASLTNQELAARCATSPATCLRRVRRLLDAGVIVRRVAILDPRHLGGMLTAISEVALDKQGAEHVAAFEERAIAEVVVQQCYRVSPGPDFVLVTHVADMDAWSAFVDRLFTQDSNVRNVKTFFAWRRAKFGVGVPLPPSSR